MKMLKPLISIIFLCVSAALTGCASRAVQTEQFFKSPPSTLPPTQLISSVPFINQSSHQCGPATLAMAMNWAGKPMTAEIVSQEVYHPNMKGSLQTDLISSSRRNGLMAIPIEGMNALMTEVSAGHPVIVFENLAFNWLPQWHYAIVVGYDLPHKKVIMHSGPEAYKMWDFDRFERSWMLGDYWGLVVLPPGQLAPSANELGHLKAASGLELAGQIYAAEKSYEAILQRWPESLTARIGLANISYGRSDFKNAVRILSEATKLHPESALAWHNLAVAQGNAQMSKQASLSAKNAVKLASGETKQIYEKNLEPWIKTE